LFELSSRRRSSYPQEDQGLNCQKDDQEYPQMEGMGQDNDRRDEGAGNEVNGNFFPGRQTLAADPFDPGTEIAVCHDPPVEPRGAFHKAKRRGQQKRRRRQHGKGNARNAQGKKHTARRNEQYF
jgi:hypothetical protein